LILFCSFQIMEKEEVIVPIHNLFMNNFSFPYDSTRLFTPYCSNSNVVMTDVASYFDDILPIELIRMIFSCIDDVYTFGRAIQVNKLWYDEVHYAWKNFCVTRKLLDDEVFWGERAQRDWKWVSLCKAVFMHDLDTVAKRRLSLGCYIKKDETGMEVWKYEGEWMHGQRHGIGTLRLPSGSTYKGEWKNGDRDGRGYLVFVNPSSSYYDGEFKSGKRHGKGLCVWVAGQWKGDRYYGDWENDFMHGYGRYTFASGAFYEGEWKEDKMNGMGTYQYRSGNQYRGQWKDDKMHGTGSYHYASGNLYIGEMVEDWKQGFGVFYYAEWGSKYEGSFSSNKPNGRGMYSYADGDRYEGEWVDGRRVGRGILYCRDGRVFHQEWLEATKHPYSNGEPAKFPPNLIL